MRVTGRSPRIAAMKSASTCQPPRSASGIGSTLEPRTLDVGRRGSRRAAGRRSAFPGCRTEPHPSSSRSRRRRSSDKRRRTRPPASSTPARCPVCRPAPSCPARGRNAPGRTSMHKPSTRLAGGTQRKHRLINDTQREHVKTRIARHLPPAQRRLRVGKLIVERMNMHLAQLADKSRGEERTHVGIPGQPVGARDDHRRQARRLECIDRASAGPRAHSSPSALRVKTCLPASKAASVTGQCR